MTVISKLENNEIDSKMISAMRFPLAVLVVLIHLSPSIAGWNVTNMQSDHMVANIAGSIMIAISHIFAHVAVPTFFLISGYLFFKKLEQWNTNVWLRKIKGRFHSVLVPYIFWVSFYIGIDLFNKLLGIFIKGKTFSGIIDWLNANGWLLMYWSSSHWNDNAVNIWGQNAISTAPYPVPLWFLRNLIVVIALSPVLYHMFKSSKDGRITIVAMISMIALSFMYFTSFYLVLPGFSSSTFFYFGLGAFLSLNRVSLANVFFRYRYVIGAFFIVLSMILLPLDGHRTDTGYVIYPFAVFLGVLTTVNLFSNSVRKRKNLDFCSKYSNATFFLYASHFFFLRYVSKLFSKLLNCFVGNDSFALSEHFVDYYSVVYLIAYFAKAFIVVFVCIVVYHFILKFFPRFTRFCCGR